MSHSIILLEAAKESELRHFSDNCCDFLNNVSFDVVESVLNYAKNTLRQVVKFLILVFVKLET